MTNKTFQSVVKDTSFQLLTGIYILVAVVAGALTHPVALMILIPYPFIFWLYYKFHKATNKEK